MKRLILSLLAIGAVWAMAPAAIASSPQTRDQKLDTAVEQATDMSARRRHWRGVRYHRVVVGPRRYRYAAPFYYRPYYGYHVYNPYFYGYPHYYYRPRPWTGYMLGLGIGW